MKKAGDERSSKANVPRRSQKERRRREALIASSLAVLAVGATLGGHFDFNRRGHLRIPLVIVVFDLLFVAMSVISIVRWLRSRP